MALSGSSSCDSFRVPFLVASLRFCAVRFLGYSLECNHRYIHLLFVPWRASGLTALVLYYLVLYLVTT